MQIKQDAPAGTIRIRAKDLKAYEKTKTSWKLSNIDISNITHIVDLFRAYDNFEILIDKKDPRYLKGQLSADNKIQGARINVLPNGTKIDKAFSLFAQFLTIHDESSHSHWDVLYKNPGGTYSYCYTLDKIQKATKDKYKKVREFEKHYPILKRKVISALKNKEDHIALAMYTLLKTCMRVGNEIYYRAHGHKGLTTLKKHDISIDRNWVTFTYLAKDGVPLKITEKFPNIYIKRLNDKLKLLDMHAFVFVNAATNHPLTDIQFKEAFKRYCGVEFYPHIVRSYFATLKAKEFLKQHKAAKKSEVLGLFRSIAEKLGHKKFSKKDNDWVDSYNVTIHHYIQPELVDKLKSIIN